MCFFIIILYSSSSLGSVELLYYQNGMYSLEGDVNHAECKRRIKSIERNERISIVGESCAQIRLIRLNFS